VGDEEVPAILVGVEEGLNAVAIVTSEDGEGLLGSVGMGEGVAIETLIPICFGRGR
jgi:hypothetical protein